MNQEQIRVAQVENDGLSDETTVLTGRVSCVFTYFGRPGTKYRIYMGAYSGYGTPPKTADTATGRNVDVGDTVMDRCPPIAPVQVSVPAPSEATRGLLDAMVIEPQVLQRPGNGTTTPLFGVVPDQLSLPLSRYQKSDHIAELPPCWAGPSLDKPGEWELLPTVYFRPFRLESFVGGNVKSIRVVRHLPYLTESQIRDYVRRVWLGVVRDVYSSIPWSEANSWIIEVAVEHTDWKSTGFLTDGVHVQIEDRLGKYWFTRISPSDH